jgi:hypothetical protein
MALDPKDPRYIALTSTPLRPALIRLLDTHSNTVDERKLEREDVRVSATTLHPGHRVLLVTTDLSAGFGSYSGPLTQLIDVSRGRLDTEEAWDSESGKLEPISLVSTLKTAWKFVPARPEVDGAKDILEIACRPNNDASAFYLIYTRYRWNGGEWVESHRQVQGFWEADRVFPDAAKFPGAAN